MISSRAANLIFINKKKEKKIGRQEHLPALYPLRLIISHFFLTLPPSQSGSHMCITPY